MCCSASATWSSWIGVAGLPAQEVDRGDGAILQAVMVIHRRRRQAGRPAASQRRRSAPSTGPASTKASAASSVPRSAPDSCQRSTPSPIATSRARQQADRREPKHLTTQLPPAHRLEPRQDPLVHGSCSLSRPNHPDPGQSIRQLYDQAVRAGSEIRLLPPRSVKSTRRNATSSTNRNAAAVARYGQSGTARGAVRSGGANADSGGASNRPPVAPAIDLQQLGIRRPQPQLVRIAHGQPTRLPADELRVLGLAEHELVRALAGSCRPRPGIDPARPAASAIFCVASCGSTSVSSVVRPVEELARTAARWRRSRPTAFRPLRSTCTSEPRASDFRSAWRTTWAQNWPNWGQVSHSAAHRALASEVNATLMPSP